jgi:hypothetical protein
MVGPMTKMLGKGGAPMRATLPEDAAARKRIPIGSGFLDYFPDAIAAVAEVSFIGNEQHNPGQPLHWDRSKSTDEFDCMMRHALQRGTRDKQGVRETARMVWRALAYLQKEIESENVDVTFVEEQHWLGEPHNPEHDHRFTSEKDRT